MMSVFIPKLEKIDAKLTAAVVLPTPPFWQIMDIVFT
jgi:hypothetical protein